MQFHQAFTGDRQGFHTSDEHQLAAEGDAEQGAIYGEDSERASAACCSNCVTRVLERGPLQASNSQHGKKSGLSFINDNDLLASMSERLRATVAIIFTILSPLLCLILIS